jgi:peptidoglycan/xylan/chitin deacetylase (PgdA/CDA1 family)
MRSLLSRTSGRISRFYRRVKYSLRDVAWWADLNRSFFSKARGTRILVYHGICRHDHLRFNTLFLTRETFESQLKFFKKYFNIISLDDYYQGKFDNQRFNVCLSFDDGFANNYKYVLPLLEQYQVPATFFITAIRDTGSDVLWNDVISMAYKFGPPEITLGKEVFRKKRNRDYVSLSSGQRLVDALRFTELDEKRNIVMRLNSIKENVDADYWLQMTGGEIKRLSESPWATIGSHSYFHHDLAKISRPVLSRDLSHSKQFLETTTGREVKALAFPYGSYNENVVLEAKKAGFKQLLATEFTLPDSKNDPTMRERLTLNPFISLINQMYAIVNGRY